MIDPTEGPDIDGFTHDYTDSVDVVLRMIYHQFPGWKICVDQDRGKIRPTLTEAHITQPARNITNLSDTNYGNGKGPTIALALLDAYADARIKALEKEADLG